METGYVQNQQLEYTSCPKMVVRCSQESNWDGYHQKLVMELAIHYYFDFVMKIQKRALM